MKKLTILSSVIIAVATLSSTALGGETQSKYPKCAENHADQAVVNMQQQIALDSQYGKAEKAQN